MKVLRSTLFSLLTLASVAPLAAQTPTGIVRGRVTDTASQQPLGRVTVTIGDRTALTAEDGRYVITSVPAGSAELRARLIGYAAVTRTVTVMANQTIDADMGMVAQALSLSEVVVTGYGEERVGNVTGAVSQLTPDEFNTGRIVSPAELIANKAPGVQVIDNNEPGGGLTIRIRGATSVNASSDPLYIIDGMPVGTGAGGGLSVAGRDPLSTLNPDEIESITVLRDASAAAIYGANAANGVVLIQTRTGRRGRTLFEYTGSLSTSQITRTPNMLNASQFRTAVQTYGAAPQIAQLGSANTNWFDQVDQAAFGQDHNLALSGMGESNSWRLSLGYLNQDGVIGGTNTERISMGLNYRQGLMSDLLDVRASVKFSRAVFGFTPGGVLGNAAQFGPTQPVNDAASQTGYYEWPNNALQSADNPVAIMNLASDHGTNLRSIGNVRAEYTLPFFRALRLNGSLGYDIARANRTSFTPSVLHAEQKTGRNGSFYQNNYQDNSSVMELFGNYAAAVGFVPGTVDVTAGYSFQQQHGEYPEIIQEDLSTDLLGPNGDPGAGTIRTPMFVEDYRLISFYGRVNYNLNDRYLASLSLRRDGSSRFGEGNQWGTFPSIALAWRISQEGFMRGMNSISDLKLRVSRAVTGNQAFGNYQQYSTYTVSGNEAAAQFGTTFVNTIRPSAVDPNIHWEETHATNVGLDLGLWNQRLSATFDWYSKKTEDLIFRVPVAAGTNFSNFVTTNIGNMSNTGFEFAINARLKDQRQSRGFGWNFTLTASHNTNELTSINPNSVSASAQQILTGGIAGGVGSTIQVLRPGSPINSFLVYEHMRDASGRPVFVDTDNDGTVENLEMYVDQDNDGDIDNGDLITFHDPAPKWIFGLSSYMQYNRFDLGFTLRAYTGNYVYNNVASNLGTYIEVTRASPYNLHASVLETGFTTPQYLSDYYVEDASFLRLDNITLGYNMTYRGQPMRLFGTVQNAFTSTGYSGVDPTAGLNGIDNNIYPRSRTFTFGLNLAF